MFLYTKLYTNRRCFKNKQKDEKHIFQSILQTKKFPISIDLQHSFSRIIKGSENNLQHDDNIACICSYVHDPDEGYTGGHSLWTFFLPDSSMFCICFAKSLSFQTIIFWKIHFLFQFAHKVTLSLIFSAFSDKIFFMHKISFVAHEWSNWFNSCVHIYTQHTVN
jgi:hypothetical protein